MKVPDGWSAIDAAPVMCTHGTAWHAAVVKGKLRPGESVLVTGASGGVGSAAVQLFNAMGARVIAQTSNADKVRQATCAFGFHAGQLKCAVARWSFCAI